MTAIKQAIEDIKADCDIILEYDGELLKTQVTGIKRQLEKLSSLMEQDASEFLLWVVNKGYRVLEGTGRFYNSAGTTNTIEQLYQLYKKE